MKSLNSDVNNYPPNNPTKTNNNNNSTAAERFQDQAPSITQVTSADSFRHILQNAVTANAFVPQYYKAKLTTATTTTTTSTIPPDEKPPLVRHDSVGSSGDVASILEQLSDSTDEEKAHIFLQNHVTTLTENPEEFDSIIREIQPILVELKSDEFLKATIDIIFEHVSDGLFF